MNPDELQKLQTISSMRSTSSWDDIAKATGLSVGSATALADRYSDTRGNIIIPDASGRISKQQAVGFNLDASGNVINRPEGFQYQVDLGTPAYSTALDKTITDATGKPVGEGGNVFTKTNVYTPPVEMRVQQPNETTDQYYQRLGIPKPIISSSGPARDQFGKNVNYLNTQTSAGYDQYGNRTGTAEAASPTKVPGTTKTQAQPQAQTQSPAISYQSSNVALNNIINQANRLLSDFQSSGYSLTPQSQQLLTQINQYGTEKNIALSSAQIAKDNGDSTGFNQAITKAKEAEAAVNDTVASLMREMQSARTDYINSLAPSAKEQELKQQLATLRSSATFAKNAIDARAIPEAFNIGENERVSKLYAAEEEKLLMELGLEVNAREFKTKALEAQIGFIAQDLNLQQAIQDRIDTKEQRLVDNARNLKQDSLTALDHVLNQFEGVAFSDLSPKDQTNLVNIANQYGIPFDILKESMDLQKQSLVFKNALDIQKYQATTGTTAGTKPPTQAQETTALYASRIKQANDIFETVASKIAALNPLQLATYRKADQIGGLANVVIPSDVQSQLQAERNFINAVLRRESGAVISPSEFESAARQYFPQPGDTAAILAQKKENRRVVQSQFISSAGGAYDPTLANPLSGGVVSSGKTSSGVGYTITQE